MPSDATSMPKNPSNFENEWSESNSVQIVASRTTCKKLKQEFIYLAAYFSQDVFFGYFFRILTCSIGLCLPSHIQMIEAILPNVGVRSNH